MQGNSRLIKRYQVLLLAGAVFLLGTSMANAQKTDSAKTTAPKSVHSPKRAMLYSAVCPGLGQIYNKKYWKLPIIYVGLGTAAYFFVTNTQYYNNYNNALKTRDNYLKGIGGPDQYYNIYTSGTLSDIVAYYRRNVDLTVIIAAGIYLLQIVDANVDAQLHGFNVSDDLSLKFTPNIVPNSLTGMMSFQPGFTLVKRF